jgi:hypothetical protein
VKPRLRAFHYVSVTTVDGQRHQTPRIFYAADIGSADRIAISWGKPRGYKMYRRRSD